MRSTAKRWAIVGILGTDVAVLVESGRRMRRSGTAAEGVGWLGAAIGAAALPAQLGGYYALRGARTSRNLTAMTATATVALAVAAAGSVRTRRAGPVLLAGAALATGQLYARWYSRLDREPAEALAVGRVLAEFDVIDSSGRFVNAVDFRGAPTAFVFIRGNWCPLCVAQVRELAAQYRALADRGIEVALVSPQPLDETRALAERFDVDFHFLSDPGARVARQLGIGHDGGVPPGLTALGYDADTVFPTVVVVDADGRILLSHQTDDYRIRPEPALFLSALDAAEA